MLGDDRLKPTLSIPALSVRLPAPGCAMAQTVKRSNISVASAIRLMLAPSVWLVRLKADSPRGGDGLDQAAPKSALIFQPGDMLTDTPWVVKPS